MNTLSNTCEGAELIAIGAFVSCVTAKLAISIARKMNALIFLVPEDIVDVRPRLVRIYPWLVAGVDVDGP